MNKYIKKYDAFLSEAMLDTTMFNIETFPEDIKKTLDEYTQYFEHKFDWNSKQEEYMDEEWNLDHEGFSKWVKDNKNNGLKANIDTVIEKLDEDIKLIDAQDKSEAKLKAFEELIIPALGNEVLSPTLNKYQERVLLNPYASLEEIEQGFREGKSIFDKDGNIDQSKIEMSDIFTGDEINIPAFEKFVEKNPEFQGVFNDWEKIYNEHMDLFLKDLNAFRKSTSKERIQELRGFLLGLKE
jgi:hypothetical protein